MKFTYNALRNAELEGDRVGNWKGYPVFACSAAHLLKKSEGACFIVYDDNNTIVRKIGTTWYSFGTVSEEGQVNEWDKKKYGTYYERDSRSYAAEMAKWEVKRPQVYCHDTETYEPAANVCGSNDPCEAAHEVVVGDVKLGLDVDATLKAAREMTVDSLLEGFNYGL